MPSSRSPTGRASPDSGSARRRTRARRAGRSIATGRSGSVIVFSLSKTSKMRSVAVRASRRTRTGTRSTRSASQHRRHREEREQLADRERALRGEPDAEHEAQRERDGRHHETRTRCRRSRAPSRSRSRAASRPARGSSAARACRARTPSARGCRARSPRPRWRGRPPGPGCAGTAPSSASRSGSRRTQSGIEQTRKTRPSSQCSGTGSPRPTTMAMRFTTSSTRPNASQRRMRPMSLHRAREQLPALPAVVERHGQVLQPGVEGVAHARLDAGPGVSTNQRRSQIMPASSTPSAKTRPASGQIALASPSASGPSTTACSTCGIASAMSWAISAATMPATMNGSAGPAYSRSLKSARTVPMRAGVGSWWCGVADKPVSFRRGVAASSWDVSRRVGSSRRASGGVGMRGYRGMGRLRLRGWSGSYPEMPSAWRTGRAAQSTATWRA